MEKRQVAVIITAEDRASSIVKNIGTTVAAAAAAAALAAGVFMKKSIDAAAEQEVAEVKLAQALGYVSTALTDQAAALQRTTMFGDETINNAQAMLAMYTKDEAKIKALTKVTLDFAQAKGVDLATASDLVGKSLASETSMLSRYGIQTSGAANSAERFTSILKGLNDHYGGQAAAAANTYTGKMTQMGNAFGDLMEEVGNIIIKNPIFLKAISAATDAFASMGTWVKNNQKFLMELAQGGIAIVVRGIGLAIQVINVFKLAWYALETAANAVVYAIVGALELLITPSAAITAALKKAGILQNDYLADVKTGLTEYRQFVGDTVKGAASDVVGAVKGFGETWTYWNDLADQITNVEMKATTAADSIVKVKDAMIGIVPPLGEFLGPMEEAEEYAQTLEDVFRRIGIASSSSAQILSANKSLSNRESQMGAQIQIAATRAMETQLLSLVETRKFSAKAIAQAIMQETKAQLIGLAAEAAVRALYFTAIGLAASSGPWGLATFGNPGAWFSAAATMAGIAGVALAGAAAVNAISGPGAQTTGSGAAGSSPSNPSYATDVPDAPGTQSGENRVTHVTVNVHNPLSNQNWDELFELDIAPAIARAEARGV